MIEDVSADTTSELLGREVQFDRLQRALGRLASGRHPLVLVSGEAGIGKTSLVRAVVDAALPPARVAWGTCVDADGAPGFWPWTQALEALVRIVGDDVAAGVAGDDAALLASIIPSLGAPHRVEASERQRLRLMDAVGRFLDRLAAQAPVIVVLDDAHWADDSSVSLLEFLARTPRHGPVALVAAYRPDELPVSVRTRMAQLVPRADHVELGGLDPDAVAALIERVAGTPIDAEGASAIHQRTGGHPFFVRELAMLPTTDGAAPVPAAVRDAIERRIGRLPQPTIEVLEVLALLGSALRPDVAAAVLGVAPADIDVAAADALAAGVVSRGHEGIVFTHDLLRETVDEGIVGRRRVVLHQAIGAALEQRAQRNGDVAPADVARHLVAAVAIDGPERATRWCMAAAAADLASLAFTEAADHLRRLRAALADAGLALEDRRLVDVLEAEASARARAGHSVEARGLLRHAADVADRSQDPTCIARVALATATLGAQFAARRDDVVRQLEQAHLLVAGAGDVWEARVAATLARELQHSVPEDRPRATPLSETALEIGRRSGDSATLLACLFARHDVLWTPGTAAERATLAKEIVAVAGDAHDEEHRAEGLLLHANALLEQGSPAYEAPLEHCLAILGSLGQPQHRYTAMTRRACVALLQGHLGEAEALIETAAALGDRIREPDTGNVRMSQRLELVRARAQPDELRQFASDALAHWVGAPVHANAVAAGFFARAGDIDAARRHVKAVVDLGTWRGDRSYLWSVFVRELAYAVVAMGDTEVAAEMLHDIGPLGATCGVNGAVVAFAGSHAHAAGLLAAVAGDAAAADAFLAEAEATYRRLGATGWLDGLASERAGLGAASAGAAASLRRRGAVWQLRFAGSDGSVPHTKGMADIARLLSAPDTDIHVLELIDAGDRTTGDDELTDRRSLAAYRQRLADLTEDIDIAERDHDLERAERAELERAAILDELRRTTGPGGKVRAFSNHPAERARKAVSARIRDAIRKMAQAQPELADHLERAIVTGTYCRYRSEGTRWRVES